MISDHTWLVLCNLVLKDDTIIPLVEDELPLLFHSDPEKEYIKKEAYEKLPQEAHEVISTILNSPDEILELITTPRFGMVSKRLLKKYFLKRGWKERKVDKVFFQLRVYVNEFGR